MAKFEMNIKCSDIDEVKQMLKEQQKKIERYEDTLIEVGAFIRESMETTEKDMQVKKLEWSLHLIKIAKKCLECKLTHSESSLITLKVL